ncbi:EBP-domain-containing protein [Xylariaceae sp. FL0662B]|nr:EBP-domain-containing protein [Xylariaceae sp. FL0662B]
MDLISNFWPLGEKPEALAPTHPYYPLGVAVPAYAPNEAPLPVLVASFAGMLGFALLSASVVALKINPCLTKSNLALLCWFVMNGCLHCFFEGYFVLNHTTIASSQNVLAQLWKEYALSDSRYLTSDFFMLSLEGITAFIWGPLCFANAVAIVRDCPARDALRITACVAHLYGVALYFGTSLCELYFTGFSHSRPEALYFWGYYVGCNIPWAIIPAGLLFGSVRTVIRATRALDKVEDTLSTHRRKGETGQQRAESRKTR